MSSKVWIASCGSHFFIIFPFFHMFQPNGVSGEHLFRAYNQGLLAPPRRPGQAGHEGGEHQQSEEQDADGETSLQGIGGLNASRISRSSMVEV